MALARAQRGGQPFKGALHRRERAAAADDGRQLPVTFEPGISGGFQLSQQLSTALGAGGAVKGLRHDPGLQLRVLGARPGRRLVRRPLDVTSRRPAGGAILQQPATPTANPNGTYSVPISMLSIATSCTVAGLVVLDGAGNVAVYGTEYGEPDLGIKLTRVPDTTPPAPPVRQ